MGRERAEPASQSPMIAQYKALKAEHPFWGYRRIWAYLPFVEQLSINKKRVLRVLREHTLLVQPNRKLKATRTPSRTSTTRSPG